MHAKVLRNRSKLKVCVIWLSCASFSTLKYVLKAWRTNKYFASYPSFYDRPKFKTEITQFPLTKGHLILKACHSCMIYEVKEKNIFELDEGWTSKPLQKVWHACAVHCVWKVKKEKEKPIICHEHNHKSNSSKESS